MILHVIIIFDFPLHTLLLLEERIMSIGRSDSIQTFFSAWFLLNFFHQQFFFVVTISFEQFFNTFLPEKQLILILFIFLAWWGDLFTIVFRIQNIDWNERRWDVLFQKLEPGEVFEPWMLLYLYNSILGTQSFCRFSLNHLKIKLLIPDW